MLIGSGDAEDVAMGVLRREYYESVKSEAEEILEEVRDGRLDEEEALRRFPDAYYELTDPEDWVVTCLKCGLVGSVDDRVQEINGLVFRVTCGTGSYKVGG